MGEPYPVAATATVKTGADAIALLSPLLPASGTAERLVVAYFDELGRVLGFFQQDGDPTGVTMPLRRIIADAIFHDASGLLIGHNHPSGDPTPSRIDIESTHQLAAAAHPLGMTLHDHLIRAADAWCSLSAMDLL